mmetsp:Transcript_23473/g.29575  ORF Transcript_23473/g.29575 Transcript_23473/m.29575 type:complete len:257 (-) Transcript_23473:1023-1793(-)
MHSPSEGSYSSSQENNNKNVGAASSNPLEVEGQSLTRRKNGVVKVTNKKQYAVSTSWERKQAENPNQKRFCTGTTEDCYSLCCCCSRRVGSMFFLCEKPDGSPIVVAGPCWPFCVFITVPMITVLSGLVLWFCILSPQSPLPSWVAFIYCPFMVLTLISLFCVSCRDPGLMERVTDEEAADAHFLWNEQVGSYRPPGAMYCRECQVLVQDYDHLCPWTGTAIGARNMFAFKAFVVSVNLLCYGSIGIALYVLFKDF